MSYETILTCNSCGFTKLPQEFRTYKGRFLQPCKVCRAEAQIETMVESACASFIVCTNCGEKKHPTQFRKARGVTGIIQPCKLCRAKEKEVKNESKLSATKLRQLEKED